MSMVVDRVISDKGAWREPMSVLVGCMRDRIRSSRINKMKRSKCYGLDFFMV